MATLQVGSASAGRGEIGFGTLPAGKLSDSTPVEIPVILIQGAQDGSTLLLSAAVHGPEITGTEVIRQVCREIVKPSELRGSIIALPVANPFGYRAASWINPEDGFNLNRTFPGNPDGWLTSRLAHVLMQNVVKRSDAIVDLHCMCEPTMLWSHVKHTDDASVYARSIEIAEAFGLGIVEQDTGGMAHRVGGMLEASAVYGIPGISPELEYWRRIIPSSVQVGIRGTLNVLRKFGMLEGKIEPQPPEVKTFPGIFAWHEIFSNEGGIVHFIAMPGAVVEKGQTVALVRNPFGDVLEEVKSPVKGTLLGYPIFQNQAVRTGELMVFIGSPKTYPGIPDGGKEAAIE